MTDVLIIGAGPAGLMAAHMLAGSGLSVTVADHKRTPARKFLRAGIGGLNLTHGERLDRFITRFGRQQDRFAPWLHDFGPDQVVAWAKSLHIDCFTGSSGRIFPVGMKAAPLLRAWLNHLRGQGITIATQWHWQGWDQQGRHILNTPDGVKTLAPLATILAMGGASWPHLGSDGQWVVPVSGQGIALAPLRPANCGFDARLSAHFLNRFQGQPIKSVGFGIDGHSIKGECMVTATGLEGGAIYALSAPLRDRIAQDGRVILTLDLKPDLPLAAVQARLSAPRGSRSLSGHLAKTLGLKDTLAGLLREGHACLPTDPAPLAQAIKAVPVILTAPRPLAESISTAGGIVFEQLTDNLMVRDWPGLFVAGEMLDWEAPTGGYLLTGCLSTGHVAGLAAGRWAKTHRPQGQ